MGSEDEDDDDEMGGESGEDDLSKANPTTPKSPAREQMPPRHPPALKLITLLKAGSWTACATRREGLAALVCPLDDLAWVD